MSAQQPYKLTPSGLENREIRPEEVRLLRRHPEFNRIFLNIQETITESEDYESGIVHTSLNARAV